MAELDIEIATLKEKMDVANHRIADLEEVTKRIESLTLSVERLALSVEQMAKEQVEYSEKQNKLATRMLEVEQSPLRDKANKHDKLIGEIATLVIGAFVGYLLKTLLGI